MLPAHKDAGTRLAHMKPAGVGIVFQREDAHDHQGLVVCFICVLHVLRGVSGYMHV